MYIDKDKVRSAKNDRAVKRNMTSTDTEVEGELSGLIQTLGLHLKHSTIEKTGNWLLFKDLWLQNECNKLPTPHYEENGQFVTPFNNYSRGDIILSLDLGTSNIGTEIRYPHPCVVLYDHDEDWLIVAPITGAKLDSEGNPVVHRPFEVLARMQTRTPRNRKEFQFRKHSVIQVDQIRRVSKYRVENKFSLKLSETLLNQIDNVILEYYLPRKYKLIKTLQEVNQELSSDFQRYKEQSTLELQTVKEELEKALGLLDVLKETTSELEEQNKELRDQIDYLQKRLNEEKNDDIAG